MKSNLLKVALLASGAALAFGTIAPAKAAPVASGFVDAWASLGHSSFSGSECEGYEGEGCSSYPLGHGGSNFNQIGGDGRGNLLWDSGFGIQLDAGYYDTKPSHDDGYDEATTDLAAHFYQRSDDMLWGGFASIGSAESNRWGTIGAEFQKYCDQWTFYGQASWSSGLDGESSTNHLDSWNFNVQARYFVTSHFMLTAGLGFDIGSGHYRDSDYYEGEGYTESYNDSLHVHSWNWTLRAEYLFSDLPVSIFGQYQGSSSPSRETRTYSYSDDYDTYINTSHTHATSNLFTIGVRLFMNQSDLQSNDRTGASLEDFNPWTGTINPISGFAGYGYDTPL
jgi:hypothetical protein